MIEYDKVFVGSSPISIMHAVRYAREGHRVALLEGATELGGAWKTQHVEGIGRVECACHLIEWYGGVYEKLADLIGVDFVKMKPQPVKIYGDGRRIPYLSRSIMLRPVVNPALYIAAAAVIRAWNRVTPRFARIDKTLRVPLRQRLSALEPVYKTRLRWLGTFRGLKSPAGGFENFSTALSRALERHGIDVVRENLKALSQGAGGRVILTLGDQGEIGTREVYLSESTRPFSLDPACGEVPTRAWQPTRYWHVLASVPAKGVPACPEYIHLPDNRLFHRITVCHPLGGAKADSGRMYLLIQTREDPRLIPGFQDEMQKIIEFCGITAATVDMRQHHVFSEEFIASSRHSPFIPGSYGDSIRVLRSIGDLGKVVSASPLLD